ncbi:MAG TPA: DNA repair exonuclease [Methanocella sp.]|nr:DNA repair exonuclease [Methanocella sp.]
MIFVHTADLHLGYRQYDLDERFRDFGRSFMAVVQQAIDARAEFVLIAGDLFHIRNINAPTYYQAKHILSMLKEAGIPCIAIEGNHDRAFIRDGMSWLEMLQSEDLLTLILPGPSGELMKNYVDIGKTRIFGLCYAGASTSRMIPAIRDEIAMINSEDRPDYTILMMHTGIEGQMKGNIIGEMSYEEIHQLKDMVDYLALGHYHNAYELDGWAYNPGSPDTCSVTEANSPKGFYLVQDGRATLIEVGRRKFLSITIPIDECMDAASLMEEIGRKLAAVERPENPPIVYILLRGCLNFDRSLIDIDLIKTRVIELLGPLHVGIRYDLSNDTACIPGLDTGNFDRLSVEREVLVQLAAADSVLAPYTGYYAAMLSEIKELAIKEADPETLDSLMRTAFEEIKNGRAPKTSQKNTIVKNTGPPAGQPVVEKAKPAAARRSSRKKPASKQKQPAGSASEAAPVTVQRNTLDQFLDKWGYQ